MASSLAASLLVGSFLILSCVKKLSRVDFADSEQALLIPDPGKKLSQEFARILRLYIYTHAYVYVFLLLAFNATVNVKIASHWYFRCVLM